MAGGDGAGGDVGPRHRAVGDGGAGDGAVGELQGERESSETWTYPGLTKQIPVECDDANDLPVAGFCETHIGQGCDVHSFRQRNWTSLSYPANFLCAVENMGGNNCTAWATILCLSVPGP